MSFFVDDDDAIGVAVERDADVGAHLPHLARQRFRRGRSALLVDVEAVRLDADREHLGAELPQGRGRDLVGGTVGAVDHHPQSVELDRLGQRALGELDVAILHAVDALGAPEIGRLGDALAQVGFDQPLDLVLELVRELVAVRPEQLDAVVVVWIVRGRDHDAEIGAHRACQHGDRRGRNRSGEQHVHTDRGEASHQRVLDHVTGEPSVLADQHPMAMLAALEQQAGRLPDLQGEVRGQRPVVRLAANAVGSEIFAHHTPSSPWAATAPVFRVDSAPAGCRS